MNYKAQSTLNEKDMLFDILCGEKKLIREYAYGLSEGVSKGFIQLTEKLFKKTSVDRQAIYFTMCDRNYEGVRSCDEKVLKQIYDYYLAQKPTLK